MREISIGRRDSLKRALFFSLSTGGLVAPSSVRAQQAPGNGRVLVAYMSRSGNTRVVAGQIARANQADLFEILPARPYPEDYQQTVDQARRESDAGYEPPLKATVSAIASYRIVFLGFPIWGMTAPPPIRSFLSQHDLAGKTMVPFITHGGYGTGRSISVLVQKAPTARITDAFVMKADQERDTLERVTEWLARRPAVR
jgi:flavodoxin